MRPTDVEGVGLMAPLGEALSHGQGVGPVEGQELVDSGLGKHPLQLGFAEPFGLAQILVVFDQPAHALALALPVR